MLGGAPSSLPRSTNRTWVTARLPGPTDEAHGPAVPPSQRAIVDDRLDPLTAATPGEQRELSQRVRRTPRARGRVDRDAHDVDGLRQLNGDRRRATVDAFLGLPRGRLVAVERKVGRAEVVHVAPAHGASDRCPGVELYPVAHHVDVEHAGTGDPHVGTSERVRYPGADTSTLGYRWFGTSSIVYVPSDGGGRAELDRHAGRRARDRDRRRPRPARRNRRRRSFPEGDRIRCPGRPRAA